MASKCSTVSRNAFNYDCKSMNRSVEEAGPSKFLYDTVSSTVCIMFLRYCRFQAFAFSSKPFN